MHEFPRLTPRSGGSIIAIGPARHSEEHPLTRRAAICTRLPSKVLIGQRWDPAFWLASAVPQANVPLAPLRFFIEHITYGPIVTGRRPSPVVKGVAIIDQKVVRPTGVLLDAAVRVEPGCVFDIPRARLRRGDLVFCRSGAGTLRKKRFTVFDSAAEATVSCFVDLIRLRNIDPHYVATVLRSRFCWPQIERLINGVGTPNISFSELHGLEIPVAAADRQSMVAERWKAVRRLHRRGSHDAALAALDAAVSELETTLEAGA